MLWSVCTDPYCMVREDKLITVITCLQPVSFNSATHIPHMMFTVCMKYIAYRHQLLKSRNILMHIITAKYHTYIMLDIINPTSTHALFRWKYSEICNKENCPQVGAKEKCGHVARKEKCIPYQLQRLFLQLQTVDKRAVETTDVTKSFGWDSSEGNFKYTFLKCICIGLVKHTSFNNVHCLHYHYPSLLFLVEL